MTLTFRFRFFWWCILLIFTTSCIDPYWPELDSKYTSALVVEGKISNKPGPYEVKVSRSSSVDNPRINPLSGCQVVISDDRGNSEELMEHAIGIYRTAADGIRGIVGHSYKISIVTAEGIIYESAYEQMAMPTEIDSIYTAIEYSPHPHYDRNITGFRFYLNTKISEQDTNYYKWDLECTYKYTANYRIKYIFDGEMHPFSPSDSLYTCYKTLQIPESFTYNTSKLSTPQVIGFPLHLVTTETKELSMRYSLIARQYSIAENAYQYWSKLKVMAEEQGALYTKLPFQIRSNVYRLDDTDEPVLGYFLVAGLSEKRIFMDRPKAVDFYYPDSCNLYPVDVNLLYIHIDQWPLLFPAQIAGDAQQPAWVDYQWCVDCTQLGGVLEFPDFWEEGE